MLLIKLVLVPSIIFAVTLAGQRWGSRAAGLLGGLPVIAGPIVIILTLEHGHAFGARAAIAAISAIVSLLGFGVAYTWASLRWPWWYALICGLATWLLSAFCLSILPSSPYIATAVALATLALTPNILPRIASATSTSPARSYVLYRMIAGALLAAGVTGAASILGATWSGLFAVFPVIGLILAVFTHRSYGSAQVVNVFRGMVQGLCSFAGFFLTFYLLLPLFSFLMACTLSIVVALLLQGLLQWLKQSRNLRLMSVK